MNLGDQINTIGLCIPPWGTQMNTNSMMRLYTPKLQIIKINSRKILHVTITNCFLWTVNGVLLFSSSLSWFVNCPSLKFVISILFLLLIVKWVFSVNREFSPLLPPPPPSPNRNVDSLPNMPPLTAIRWGHLYDIQVYMKYLLPSENKALAAFDLGKRTKNIQY